MIYLDGKAVEFGSFPNGETMLKVELERNRVYSVDFKYEGDADLFRLMLLKKYIDQVGAHALLRMMYMPYSRMDRTENDSAFTLKYVTQFINSLNFEDVYVLEPHSDVTMAMLERAFPIYVTVEMLDDVLEMIGFDKDKDYLFFPDAGAQKRYSKLKGFKQAVGFKKRDFQTGKIEGLEIVGDIETGAKVLILDDLCSRGGTFLHSASKLRDIGAGEVYLFVGHAEDSMLEGQMLLAKHVNAKNYLVDKIFTTDSMFSEKAKTYIKDELSDRIHVFNLIKESGKNA